jgi:ABC-type dipeptide/oligopeptide/nickel transport system permease component
MPMGFLAKRTIRLLVVFFIVLVLNFLLPRIMPGNPASILANQYELPPETVKIL